MKQTEQYSAIINLVANTYAGAYLDQDILVKKASNIRLKEDHDSLNTNLQHLLHPSFWFRRPC